MATLKQTEACMRGGEIFSLKSKYVWAPVLDSALSVFFILSMKKK
jgi:hypothetical protein